MAYRAPRWLVVLCALSAITALWFAAFATEVAARIIHQALMRLGGELPSLTAMVVTMVKLHVPWVVAAAATVLLAWLVVRENPCALLGCVVAAVVAALIVSVAALAFAMPLSLCGDIWPDWTAAARDAAQVTGKSTPAVSCR